MRKPKPSGRTRLLGEGGRPLTARDEERAAPAAPEPTPKVEHQRRPRDWRSGVPASYGRLSEDEARRLDEIGKRRRGGD